MTRCIRIRMKTSKIASSMIALLIIFSSVLLSRALAETSPWTTFYGNLSSYERGSQGAIISLDLDPQNLMNSSMRIASREGRLREVQHLITLGAEIDSRADTGETALMVACRNCSVKLAKFLIQHGASFNAADFDGRTALIYAARESCAPIVSLLLSKTGIDLEAKDQASKTALDYAGENSVFEVGGPSQKIVALIKSVKFLKYSKNTHLKLPN